MPAMAGSLCLLKLAIWQLTPGQLKAALLQKLGLEVKKDDKAAMRRQILRVAYQNSSAHAHAWEKVVASVLTKKLLLDISSRCERGPWTDGIPDWTTAKQHPMHQQVACSLRLAGACGSLNKKDLVNALKEANWKMLRPKLRNKASKRRKNSNSATSGALTSDSRESIRAAVQEAYQAKGLGSTMLDIRSHVAQRTSIACDQGAARIVCDKAILKILRKRAKLASNRPACPVPKFVPKAIQEQAAGLFREQAAMTAAESESRAWNCPGHMQD